MCLRYLDKGRYLVNKANTIPWWLYVKHWSYISFALTHWGRDKMAAISHTTLWSALSWMKMYEFRLKFLWILFPSAVLEIPTGPPVRGRQLWRRTGNFLLIFLQFYVYDLRFKAWGPTTFLTEFQTLPRCPINNIPALVWMMTRRQPGDKPLFFGFTFLNILYFFKYSWTNIFHRRSLYTFYLNQWWLLYWRIYMYASLGLNESSHQPDSNLAPADTVKTFGLSPDRG